MTTSKFEENTSSTIWNACYATILIFGISALFALKMQSGWYLLWGLFFGYMLMGLHFLLIVLKSRRLTRRIQKNCLKKLPDFKMVGGDQFYGHEGKNSLLDKNFFGTIFFSTSSCLEEVVDLVVDFLEEESHKVIRLEPGGSRTKIRTVFRGQTWKLEVSYGDKAFRLIAP